MFWPSMHLRPTFPNFITMDLVAALQPKCFDSQPQSAQQLTHGARELLQAFDKWSTEYGSQMRKKTVHNTAKRATINHVSPIFHLNSPSFSFLKGLWDVTWSTCILYSMYILLSYE